MLKTEIKSQFKEKLRELVNKISDYNPDTKVSKIKKAFWFGYDAHINQKRRSGDPYFSHCVEAALNLTEFRMDETTISACLLHDVVEDTGINLEDIKKKFGITIATLVDGVTKISDLDYKKSENKEAESFRKLVLYMARDIRVIMIKFADRLHNMHTLEHLSRKQQVIIAQETQDIYAPLAFRFGIAKLGWQLEDLALKYLEPKIFKSIDKKVVHKWDERMSQIDEMKKTIEASLDKLGIKCKIYGRPKSYYSIYKKMEEKKVSFDGIFDLLAMRIIVHSKEDCYAAVGSVHTHYTPVIDRFKDFIATPKNNGYQSIHTTVHTPRQKMLEIQIRTESMNRTADLGIAAHWLYKAKFSDRELNKKLGWIKEVIDWDSDNPDPKHFMETFAFDLSNKEILVSTPKGKLISLPELATPVDFAFAVHTEVGFSCIGVKVNSIVVPLNSQLITGDDVEILTSNKQNPQENWLSFAVTSKAITQIKKWINENTKLQQEAMGYDILSNEFDKNNLNLSELDSELIKLKSGYSDLQMVLGAIGRYEVTAEKIVKRLYPNIIKKNKISFLKRIPEILKRSEKENISIKIQGDLPLVIKLASCCMPIPGDKIAGFLESDNSVKVHRAKCKKIPHTVGQNIKNINVKWSDTDKKAYPVKIQVTGEDRKHFLKDMAVVISSMNIYIIAIHIEVHDILAVCDITMEIPDTNELKQVITNIESVKGIQKAKRI